MINSLSDLHKVKRPALRPSKEVKRVFHALTPEQVDFIKWFSGEKKSEWVQYKYLKYQER
jgi:hypothetical protein